MLFRSCAGKSKSYSEVFGGTLVELGRSRSDLVAITAAMRDGTGLAEFSKTFPDRFFDVGIAEGHGVTFSAGLATEGIRPVVAIYSTFLQRAYDSIVHDVAIQRLPVVFAMDRAGLVGNDGPTHMGLYDIAFLLAVPNMTVTAPKDGAELAALLRLGLAHDGPFTVRYPRDNVPAAVPALAEIPDVEFGTWEVLRRGRGGLALLGVGTMVQPALEAARILEAAGIDATVVNCRFLKPIDAATFEWVRTKHDAVITVEEGTVVNGFGAAIAREIEARRGGDHETRIVTLGVPDRVIAHASRSQQLEEVGLTAAAIAEQARSLALQTGLFPVRETA